LKIRHPAITTVPVMIRRRVIFVMPSFPTRN